MDQNQNHDIKTIKSLVRKVPVIEYQSSNSDAIEDIVKIELDLSQLSLQQLKAIKHHCRKIKHFQFYEQQANDDMLRQISLIVSLQSLKIYRTLLMQFQTIDHIINMTNLKYLHFSNKRCTQQHITQIALKLVKLQRLTLQCEQVDLGAIEILKELKYLVSLGFRLVLCISQKILHQIFKNLKQLRKLQFMGCMFQKQQQLLKISQLINLQQLDLDMTQIGKHNLIKIMQQIPSSLKSIDLSGQNHGFEVISKLVTSHTNIQQIKLQNSQIQANILTYIAQNTKSNTLKNMYLWQNLNISDQNINKLVTNHYLSLKILKIDICNNITDDSLKLISSIKQLQQLGFADCSVTDKSLIYLRRLTALIRLRLEYKSHTLPNIIRLLQNLKKLKNLVLYGTKNKTEQQLCHQVSKSHHY